MPSTTSLAAVLLFAAAAVTVTTASIAWPSCEAPASRTRVTPETCRVASSSRPIAAVSAAVSGPDSLEATMIAVAEGLPLWNGAARRAACTLGLDGDRN